MSLHFLLFLFHQGLSAESNLVFNSISLPRLPKPWCEPPHTHSLIMGIPNSKAETLFLTAAWTWWLTEGSSCWKKRVETTIQVPEYSPGTQIQSIGLTVSHEPRQVFTWIHFTLLKRASTTVITYAGILRQVEQTLPKTSHLEGVFQCYYNSYKVEYYWKYSNMEKYVWFLDTKQKYNKKF